MNYIKTLLGPLIFLFVAFILKPTGNFSADVTASLALWMAWWWMSEAVHLMVTSFLPIIILPLFGVASSKIIASQYMDSIMFLFIGGFIIGFAIEKSGLHKRMAFAVINKIGTNPNGLLAAIMISAYLISNWISNTATTMLLVPAVIAIIGNLNFSTDKSKLPSALLIGLAYSATIGGMATLIGTPPNMVFFGFYNDYFPNQIDMDFMNWSKIALPISVGMLIICYFFIWLFFLKNESKTNSEKIISPINYIHVKWSVSEKWVCSVFLTTAILWLTRSGITVGETKIAGWEILFVKDSVQDATVAMMAALLLMVVPLANNTTSLNTRQLKPVLEFADVKKIPFEILMLFGSGFALAKAFEISGLNVWIASRLEIFNGAPLIAIIFGICILATVISEFASNVASIQLLLPILLPFSDAINVSPLTLMVPATLAASLGFMLPVATAPNTIVFGTGHLRTAHFLKTGVWLDVSGIVLITFFSWLVYC